MSFKTLHDYYQSQRCRYPLPDTFLTRHYSASNILLSSAPIDGGHTSGAIRGWVRRIRKLEYIYKNLEIYSIYSFLPACNMLKMVVSQVRICRPPPFRGSHLHIKDAQWAENKDWCNHITSRLGAIRPSKRGVLGAQKFNFLQSDAHLLHKRLFLCDP